jgi:hypothetical protein
VVSSSIPPRVCAGGARARVLGPVGDAVARRTVSSGPLQEYGLERLV